jgi:hypothetical protein
MSIFLEMSAARRRDPNYIQIAGDVKKEIGLKFKSACALKELSLGQGMESAISLWLSQQEQTETKKQL